MKLDLGRKSKPAAGRQRRHSEGLNPRLSQLSYKARGDQPNTGRLTARQKLEQSQRNWLQFWLQRFGLLILLVAVAFSLGNILKLSSRPKILPLDTSAKTTFLRNTEVYEAAGQKRIAASLWNGNKLTFDTKDISRQLEAQFPELDSVSVTIPLLSHRPIVYIAPAQPALILTTSDSAYVVSTSGKALLKANSAADFNLPSLPVISDQSGLPLELNRQALSSANVAFINNVLAQLKSHQITPDSINLPSGVNELDIKIAGQAYSVKFNLHSDKAREQAGTYLATLNYLQKQSITPSQYIDVRVAGRAYYQ